MLPRTLCVRDASFRRASDEDRRVMWQVNARRRFFQAAYITALYRRHHLLRGEKRRGSPCDDFQERGIARKDAWRELAVKTLLNADAIREQLAWLALPTLYRGIINTIDTYSNYTQEKYKYKKRKNLGAIICKIKFSII